MADITLGSLVAEVHGSGTPVVMVHGLGGSSNTFQPLMETLRNYQVIRPDLPGAGRSALKPGLPGLPGLASAVQDLLRAQRIARAHFVGHSMGTLICQYLAAQSPELVASLALYGAILEPPPPARDGLKDRAAAARRDGMSGIADAVSQASLAKTADPVARAFVRESLLRQAPAGYAAHCEALAAAKPAEHDRIACPTLLIAGDQDPVAPVAMAQSLCGRIPGAKLEILAGVGHWMTMEAPAKSASLLSDHLGAQRN